MSTAAHIPVLLEEVLTTLSPHAGDCIVDATVGLGGHSALIAKQIGPGGKLYAFDQDADNLQRAEQNLSAYRDHITFIRSNFAHLHDCLQEQGVSQIDGILFDIGVSSVHFDDAQRGFSFSKEGPLDMRMDTSQNLTAAEVVNQFSEKRIADIIYTYGEERASRKIAREIVKHRGANPFTTTTQLAELIKDIFPHSKGIHPATKTFQALRIYVNHELDVLQEGLKQAFELLKPGGRMVVISFHSLEDRIVKNMFRAWSRRCSCPDDAIRCTCDKTPEADLITKKPLVATDAEVEQNPRSRSAKLRALIKK